MTNSVHPVTTRVVDLARPSDDEIVARVLGGEREAYAVLVQRYQQDLFRFALGMIGNSDEAADVVQDSLVRAFASLNRCRDPSRFGAWIHRILRNRCLDYLKARRKYLPIDDVTSYATDAAGAEREIDRDETRIVLFAALASLPETQREAFLLKHLEDRSYEEMAETLGASVSALKMRVKRAREALQAVLVRRNSI